MLCWSLVLPGVSYWTWSQSVASVPLCPDTQLHVDMIPRYIGVITVIVILACQAALASPANNNGRDNYETVQLLLKLQNIVKSLEQLIKNQKPFRQN